jgi:hypothetical protein
MFLIEIINVKGKCMKALSILPSKGGLREGREIPVIEQILTG